jgi:copper chaperone CopZ
MTTALERIPVTRLACPGCDCGACVTEATTKIKSCRGVVYVGIDRFTPAFLIRFDDDTVTPEAFRSAITASKIELR